MDPVFKFHGSSEHCPMWWSVEDPTEDVRWAVLESYNEGKTWITNCILDSNQAAWDFIAAWFAQFY